MAARTGVRWAGPTVRLYSGNAHDWTARLAAIAATAELIKAKSFTIDGEAVALGPDGLSRFEELSRRNAARTAVLYAFDLIEHDGEDLRNLPFLDRKAALARLLRDATAASCRTNTSFEDGPTVFAHTCRLGAKGIVSKRAQRESEQVICRARDERCNGPNIAPKMTFIMSKFLPLEAAQLAASLFSSTYNEEQRRCGRRWIYLW